MPQEAPSPGKPVPSGYWGETCQPIYSAVVVLPFLAVYEIGLLLLRSDEINGGDAILLNMGGPLVRWMGLGAGSASIIALVLFFLIAQFTRKGSWRIKTDYVIGAFVESLVYAILLFIVLGYLVKYLPREYSMRDDNDQRAIVGLTARRPGAEAGGARLESAKSRGPTRLESPRPKTSSRSILRDFVLYCGAGVYEELVFRVLLLGLLLLVFHQLFHMESAYAAAWAVVLGALIFAAFHHINGERFHIGRFSQRVFAGLYFSVIYYNRNYGVAVASHALYDILIGLTMITG